MPVEVIMPKVDMDMSHGTVATWHVAEGAEVTKGAALFDMETDKAAMEVEAPATGRLACVSAKPGERVPVGSVIAMILVEGDAASDGDRSDEAAAGAAARTPTAPAPAPEPGPSMPAVPVVRAVAVSGSRATPAARAVARQAGISLEDLSGTGPRGRIQRQDVEAAIARVGMPEVPLPAPAGWTTETGPLHVTRREGVGRPLVLIHGFAADSQSWAPLEKRLDPGRALIRIDLPGHGRSPRLRVRGFPEMARLVADAFDAATRESGPAHLLGHSLGGGLALSLADIRAPRLASLSLIAPAGLGPEIDGTVLRGIAGASRAESLGPWLRRLTAEPETLADDYVRAAMRQRSDPQMRHYQLDLAEALFPDGTQSFDLRPALARLTMPAVLLWGRMDRVLPHRHAFAAEGEVAMHLFKSSGHVPQIECPDRIAAVLRRHFASAEAVD